MTALENLTLLADTDRAKAGEYTGKCEAERKKKPPGR